MDQKFLLKTHRFQSTGFALVVTKEANRQTLEEECKDGADIAQMVISVCRNGPRLHPRKQPVIRQNGKEIGKKYYLNINKLQRSEARLSSTHGKGGLSWTDGDRKNYLGKPPETAASYLGVKAMESFSFYTRATVSGLNVYMGLGTNDLIT